MTLLRRPHCHQTMGPPRNDLMEPEHNKKHNNVQSHVLNTEMNTLSNIIYIRFLNRIASTAASSTAANSQTRHEERQFFQYAISYPQDCTRGGGGMAKTIELLTTFWATRD